MASLSTQNPHQASNPPSTCCAHEDTQAASIRKIFKTCRGGPISEASKSALAILFNGANFPLADVRLLLGPETGDFIDLEFFLDGETDQLGDNPGNFSSALAEKITEQFKEECAKDLRKILEEKDDEGMENFKQRKVPDLEISQLGPDSEAFRDAGCMLRFIAVRMRLNPAAAIFVGKTCFPELFGGVAEIDDRPVPGWLAAVAVAAGVLLVAVIYAWGTIIRRALSTEEL